MVEMLVEGKYAEHQQRGRKGRTVEVTRVFSRGNVGASALVLTIRRRVCFLKDL